MLVKFSVMLALCGIVSAVHTPPQARAATAKKEAERRQIQPVSPFINDENYRKIHDIVYGDEKRHDVEGRAPEDNKRQAGPAMIPGGVIEMTDEIEGVLEEIKEGQSVKARSKENDKRQVHPALIPGGVIENVDDINEIIQDVKKRQSGGPSLETLEDLPELFMPFNENGD